MRLKEAPPPVQPLLKEGPVTVRETASRHESAGIRTVYLHPGQIFVSNEPSLVRTILGSCVAVCLWDPFHRVGGMNHYLLPCGPDDGPSSARFGNVAIGRLLERLQAIGVEKSDLQAQLFGGACVIEAFRNKDNHLGMKNVRVARHSLAREGIPVLREEVEGDRGRKLIFRTHEGSVQVTRL